MDGISQNRLFLLQKVTKVSAYLCVKEYFCVSSANH